MPDEKPPLDRALDLFVYAPVGVALYVRDMFPSMMGIFVSRGKREVKSHLGGNDATTTPMPSAPPVPVPDVADLARKVGESIGVARGMAGGGIGLARDVTGSALQGFMSWRSASQDDTRATVSQFTAPGTAARADAAAAAPAPPSAPSSTSAAPPSPSAPSARSSDAAASATPAPDVDTLPIPDYDELSASQVIERLEGLDAASLDAIRAYESGHRGRNTILGKIAQLR
ncbi:MAG TPA: hypothetical protein VH986_06550 [Acidimicrobiia bacterium]